MYQVFTTLLLCLPLWLLYFIPASNRPKSTWTLKRTLIVRFIRHIIHVATRAGSLGHTPDYLTIEEGPKVNGVWIAPAPHLVVGKVKEWATAASVESVRIPGYWFHKEGHDRAAGAPAIPREKVLLAFHGGAYVRRSAHSSDGAAQVVVGILQHVPSLSRALNVEYRLTKTPPHKAANPFPAALIDAIASYNYLVHEVGFDPSDIIVKGDSAGGNLALALVRYLVENRSLPRDFPAPPAALILTSPWADLSDFGHDPRGSIYTNIPTDFLNLTTGHTAKIVQLFLGPLDQTAAETNRYISPASISSAMEKASYEGFPKTFILGGGSEAIRDQIRVLYARMSKDMGKDVVYLEQPDVVHDILVFRWFEPEVRGFAGDLFVPGVRMIVLYCR